MIYLGVWCPTCRQDALPLRDGTCGWCDTKIAPAETLEPWHGTGNGYTKRKCRCVECREWCREYKRAYRARKRAA